jgi:predicted acetyltransferase
MESISLDSASPNSTLPDEVYKKFAKEFVDEAREQKDAIFLRDFLHQRAMQTTDNTLPDTHYVQALSVVFVDSPHLLSGCLQIRHYLSILEKSLIFTI